MGRGRRLRHSYSSSSAAATHEIGRAFGQGLSNGVVVCFFGDLGAGKTTFIKGLVEGAAGVDPAVVHSPTFSYLHVYEGKKKIYHFDLYRLRDIDEFVSMGFDEYFEAGGICCIEWSERIALYLPVNTLYVTLEHAGGDNRLITIREENGKS